MYSAVRIIAMALAVALVGGGIFLVYDFYAGQQTLIAADPGYAVSSSSRLLNFFLAAAIASVVASGLFVYVVIATQARARRMAYALTKDISFTKEQFRRFYELSPVPYLLVTPEGKITRPNKASVRFFGISEEELLNRNLFSFLTHPEHPEKIARYRERAMRNVPIEQVEVQVTLLSGVPHWALLSIENLAEAGGKPQGLVTLVDINEQKELDRIKTEFLSLASHQLRAPLSNLKWYISFLVQRRRNQLTDEVLGYLEKMYHRNEDMIDLVNTLLNLSRLEMGRLKVDKVDTDMTELAQGVIEEVTPSAVEKKISLVREYPEGLHCVTDGKLVRIILQNLMTNAIRYTKESGTVHVRMQSTRHGLVLEVEDTGVGIPPEEQGRIFQKLYRATNAKEMEVNGNGIGLYMCKALAEGLGGSISFKSTVGKGTTFTVDIPND